MRKRDDKAGESRRPLRHTEQLAFESVHLATRSYK